MHVLGIIFGNFSAFDAFILLIAAINGLNLAYNVRLVRRLQASLKKLIRVNSRLNDHTTMAEAARRTSEDDVVAQRQRSARFYSAFVTVTAIFPLLGIMGTVLSLIPMVSQIGVQEMQQNFSVALTSTFWGLFWAILFKMADAIWLSPFIEDNESEVALFLERYDGGGEDTKP